MEMMWIILPLALVIAGVAVLAFAWAVRSGQFEDLTTPAMRVLVEEEEAREGRPPDRPC